MEKLPVIEMSELKNCVVEIDSYQDVLSVIDMDAASIEAGMLENEASSSSPVRMQALVMIMVLQGEAKISLDYVSYTIAANCFITIMPVHVCQVAEISPDFKCKLIFVKKSFIDDYHIDRRSPSMANFMLIRKNPCTEFSPEETKHIGRYFQLMREKVRMRTHSFHKEVVQNSFITFLLELGNIMMGKKESLTRPTLTRKEEILSEFLQLLFTHVRDRHNVSFYAEKLFITPQYLSLTLKEQTGKSANKWIDDALMVEAKVLLKTPRITVQQVADQLNFSDQSTFGKFFKKQTGVSPMEYRKS
ncbi:Arabinose operon regulatory protein [Bacteroidales bacterium Barb7]|nr:Arabinose operon regulatory protein [Bacteroidales bacterium Barb7]